MVDFLGKWVFDLCRLMSTPTRFLIKMRKKYFTQDYGDILIVAVNKKLLSLIIAALDLVKREDKRSFKKVMKCLKIICIPASKGGLNGVYEKERIWIAEGGLIENNQSSYIASAIIHEAHHIAQYFSGHKYKLPSSEISALREQKLFLKKIGDTFSLDWLDSKNNQEWWKKVVGNKKATSKLDSYLKIAK